MGRQAHITRLALGRSPFGEPLRDENGDFVLGSHARDNEALGYRQQFDDRGHPRNRSSEAAARRLRRAQNNVLATVGVVVRTGEERKTIWEKLGERGKRNLVRHENQQGRELKAEDRLLAFMLSWSISCLRKRFMTFGPYFFVPIVELISRECRVLGYGRFFLAGLPFHLLGGVLQFYRKHHCNHNVHQYLSYIHHWRNRHTTGSLHESIFQAWKMLLLQCVELPIMIHATLQMLSIVSMDALPHPRSFIPFSEHSAISIPSVPSGASLGSFVSGFVTIAQEPLFLYLVRDHIQVQMHWKLYGLFRQLLNKPDNPDAISASVADDTRKINETDIAGIGYLWPVDDPAFKQRKRYHGKRSFWGAVSITFPWAYKLVNVLSRHRLARSRGNLTPLLERQLQAAVRDKYWDERSKSEHPPPRRGSPEDMELRTSVVESVFASANLIPGEELVEPMAWTNDTLGPKADVISGPSAELRDWNRLDHLSTSGRDHQQAENDRRQTDAANSVIAEAFQATPTSDAVVIQANDGQIVMATQRAPHDALNVAEMNNIHTIQAADVPLEVLLRALESMEPEPEPEQSPDQPQAQSPLTENGIQQLQELDAVSASFSPSTPVPGISRAPSLSDPRVQSPAPTTTPLRPLRRPTETDDSLAAISETLRAEAESMQSPSPITDNPDPRRRSSISIRPPQPQTLHQTIENEPLTTPRPDPPLVPLRHRKYRVTMLSNHAADSLAWHASGLLTSFVLWPLEAMWLRSVAKWAVSNAAMNGLVDPWWAARLAYGVLGGQSPTAFGVLGLDAWFGGAVNARGRWQYAGGVMLCLGLEGLARGASWGLGVWCVKRWKGNYGWGQF